MAVCSKCGRKVTPKTKDKKYGRCSQCYRLDYSWVEAAKQILSK